MIKSRLYSIFFLLFAFFVLTPSAFAMGRREAAPDPVPVNPEFVLLITAFDVSALPLARQLMGETVMRSVANSLEGITFRLRGEEESDFYRDYAWENSRAEAARALQTSRNQRDLLLFRGEPRWRYRRDLRNIDATIAELEQRLAEIDSTAPVVEGRPYFSLSDRNRDGHFPPPPLPGDELRFATEQRIDAFLAGSISEFHGRVYLETRIYTLHTRSFSYAHSILFSSIDLVSAMDEITGQLVAAVSGVLPAGIIVRATPADAMVIIDGVLAGRGDMEIHPHFPGEVEVVVQADNHAPFSFPLTLNPGELAEIFIDLTPLSLSVFEIVVPNNPGSLVYHGGLFIGETPLTFQVPRGQFAYITVETPDGQIGTVIYRNDQIVRGNARLARHDLAMNNLAGNGYGENGAPAPVVPEMAMIINTAFPLPPEARPVERARRGFYRAYGALWIILPAALLTSGIAMTYINANAFAPATMDAETRRRVHDNAVRANNARTAAFSVMGVTLGITVIQIIRYLNASSRDAMPLIPVVPVVPLADTEEP